MYGSMVLQMRISPTDSKQAMTTNLTNPHVPVLFWQPAVGAGTVMAGENLLTALQSWHTPAATTPQRPRR
jgi:hypothetical protein